MFLDYFALGVLVFVAIVIFYGIIAIHDIPYEIAKSRNHPHQDAIHVAGLGQPADAARDLAVPLDLGPGSRLGLPDLRPDDCRGIGELKAELAR